MLFQYMLRPRAYSWGPARCCTLWSAGFVLCDCARLAICSVLARSLAAAVQITSCTHLSEPPFLPFFSTPVQVVPEGRSAPWIHTDEGEHCSVLLDRPRPPCLIPRGHRVCIL